MPSLIEQVRAKREQPKAVQPGRLTLAQFAGSGRIIVIHSQVLAEEVVFAADNARVPSTETRPIYRAQELAAVWGGDGSISADGLRLLHETKTRFGAEVVR